ncbi:MAG: 5-methylthioribose kinase [Arcticibacterium sp.]|jgi:5-methylthioribose kinase
MKITAAFTAETEAYFRKKGWLKPKEEVISFAKAGEGNMNFVARVSTNHGSFIVKQSRDYVEKYQQVPAPIERIEVENAFYELVSVSETLKGFSPEIIAFDKANHTLVMADLGQASDYTGLYSKDIEIGKEEIKNLMTYLTALHSLEPKTFLDNSKMKELNHEHIFNYPFLEENGFDLDSVQEGLQDLAMVYKTNELLKKKATLLGERYLSNGITLLHGDYYPGSWLNTERGLKVIDPEFGFMGDAEFDLGVMLAHFKMSDVDEALINFTLEEYKTRRTVDLTLLNQYIGIEILRRLIGLAQLPLGLSLDRKKALLNEAEALVLNK